MGAGGGALLVVQYLMKENINGVIVSCRDNCGNTPLHMACEYGQLEVVKYLIEDMVCDPCVENNKGITAANIAARGHHREVTSYMKTVMSIITTTWCRALVKDLVPYTRKAKPIGRDLGSGSYGKVIELESAQEIVAGKVFKRILDSVNRESIMKKIGGEMVLMMEINHPNIVQSKGVCMLPEHPIPVLLMELLMCSVHAYVLDQVNVNLPLQKKVAILHDVISGLDYLHNRKPAIIHRDLTAKNVLLTSSLNAKICDFGNARIMDLDPKASPDTLTACPGTVHYMPPEAQGQHADYGPSLDVFSFGHLALFIMSQSHMNDNIRAATYTDDAGIHSLSEVCRRCNSFEIVKKALGNHHPLLLLMENCLHNRPDQRPRTSELLAQLQQPGLLTQNTAPVSSESDEEKDGVCGTKQVQVGEETAAVSDTKETEQQALGSDNHKSNSSSNELQERNVLDEKPTLTELCTLDCGSEEINIMGHIAADWKAFGVLFAFDSEGNFVDIIEAECDRQKPMACYQRMMKHWLAGKGRQPATWRTLITLLRRFDRGSLADTIESVLGH